MKRLICIALAMSLMLTGCGWLDGEYHSVTPHRQHSDSAESNIETAENYLQLRSALEEMVSTGTESRVITVSDFLKAQLKSSMDMAVRYVKTSYPIGAYAVEEIAYEVGTVGGATAVAVEVTYRHERSELQKIRNVADMEQAAAQIENALIRCEPGLVMMVDEYVLTDIQQWVEDYAAANPSAVMETPEVSEQLYPSFGVQRVWVLKFTYQSSRDSLRSMQEQVERIFDSAALYVTQDAEDAQKLSQLYSFLMERFNTYQIKTSITPAYSLLNHGVGDSAAFAEVYAEMCARAGLECGVVVGTRNGDPWTWNIVREGEYYYHVDLLDCQQRGSYGMMTDAEMANYVWDYSAYPACTGRPPVVNENYVEEEGEPEPQATTAPPTEETELPEETAAPETSQPVEETHTGS